MAAEFCFCINGTRPCPFNLSMHVQGFFLYHKEPGDEAIVCTDPFYTLCAGHSQWCRCVCTHMADTFALSLSNQMSEGPFTAMKCSLKRQFSLISAIIMALYVCIRLY